MKNKNRSHRLAEALFEKKDISSVVFFRIAFGLIMIWGVGKDLLDDRIYKLFHAPNFHVKYYGFEWIPLIPHFYLEILFYILVVLSAFIAIGLLYRISIVLFFLGFSYVFLLDMSYYLNHHYLIVILSFLMIFIPANRYFSLDAKIWPNIKSENINSWCIYILIFQLAVVYFYGGLGKINSDYLLGGEPVGIVLHANSGIYPLIGKYFTKEWVVYSFAYAGLLFDLLIVPFLIWSKSRIYAYVVCVIFHLINFKLFIIGIFPWFMIFATLIFLPPSWPRDLLRRLTRSINKDKEIEDSETPENVYHKIKLVLITIFVVFQIAIPLRHHLYPGEVRWTDQGYFFSWLMIGRAKEARNISFIATDPDTGMSSEINAKKYLALNAKQIDEITARPFSIVRLAHFFADRLKEEGHENMEIRTNVQVTLNGRKFQYLIDPEVDLAGVDPGIFNNAEWIVPLKNSLPSRQNNIIHNYLDSRKADAGK